MKYIAFIFLVISSFSFANTSSGRAQEYLDQVEKQNNFIKAYMSASQSFRKKREYSLQEHQDYTCNLKLLFGQLIDIQSKYPELDKLAEFHSINKQTEDHYRNVVSALNRLNVSCSEEIVNVPVDTF